MKRSDQFVVDVLLLQPVFFFYHLWIGLRPGHHANQTRRARRAESLKLGVSRLGRCSGWSESPKAACRPLPYDTSPVGFPPDSDHRWGSESDRCSDVSALGARRIDRVCARRADGCRAQLHCPRFPEMLAAGSLGLEHNACPGDRSDVGQYAANCCLHWFSKIRCTSKDARW